MGRLVLLAALVALAACKGRNDNMAPVNADELKKGATPTPPPPKPAPPPSATARLAVPSLGVEVNAPTSWKVEVPKPGANTLRGPSLADGFVQVNEVDVVPASPEEAAAQRCLGANSKAISKERTLAGAIFVVCEVDFQGNKSRSINAWVKSPKSPKAAQCMITTDRNWPLLESVCRSLRPTP